MKRGTDSETGPHRRGDEPATPRASARAYGARKRHPTQKEEDERAPRATDRVPGAEPQSRP